MRPRWSGWLDFTISSLTEFEDGKRLICPRKEANSRNRIHYRTLGDETLHSSKRLLTLQNMEPSEHSRSVQTHLKLPLMPSHSI